MKIIKYVADTVKEKTTGGQKCPSDFMFYKYFYDVKLFTLLMRLIDDKRKGGTRIEIDFR